MDYFPNNTLSNYIVKPSQTLDVPNYECALSEIIFPNRLFNVRNNCNTIVVRRMRKKKGDDYAIKGTIIVPPGYYDSIENLIETIDEAGLSKRFLSAAAGPKRRSITISYDEKEKKVTVTTLRQYAVQFGSDIASLLGFALSYEPEWGGKFTKIMEGAKKGEFHATTSGGLNTLYIYTDIIKEQHVGGINAPLLRIINLNRKTNNEEYSSRTFDRLYFAPLKKSEIDSINIRIYDDTGELVHFEYGKVVVFLQFQKSI